MRTRRTLVSVTLVSAALLVLAGCSEPWLKVQHVPENGYDQTINYQFQARIHADDAGLCKSMVVRVKAQSKLYSGDEPPARLQLFDDDCTSPLRFERAQYLTNRGEQMRISGIDVTRFLGEYSRMESELVGWLWRSGVI